MKMERSHELFALAQEHLSGGVNSPARAFGSVGGTPPFMLRGEGCRLFDADGNGFIDYVGSFGPLILGHAHPRVVEALEGAIGKGTSFGAPTPLETELAQLIKERVPGIDKLRFVNSGTEATMSALRLARGYTGRDRVVKFTGCYHGHGDSFLVQAGSGVATLGLPDSPGVPASLSQLTISIPFNDLEAAEEAFASWGDQIAAVILEPVAGNMGVVPPGKDFLGGLRKLTQEWGSLLIFDEVMTGFRIPPGSASQKFGIAPDLFCFGKIIGGGLPVGAYGGRGDIMAQLAPEGPVYQAGTLSGNPLAMAAGLATLELLQEDKYRELEGKTLNLTAGIKDAAEEAGVPVTINQVGAMFTVFFTNGQVFDFASAKDADTKRYARFFHSLLEEGVYFPPSQFEAAFLSLAHRETDLEETLAACKKALEAAAD